MREILLANYGNRANRGTILFGIDFDGKIEKKKIDVRNIKNNAYHRVIFDEVKLKDFIEASKIYILLEGVDSERGSAVTAWTIRNTRFGALITNEDHLKDRSLVLRIGYIESPITKRSFPLITITILTIVTLIIPLFGKNEL